MKKALIVGLNYYNTPSELHGCVNDSTNLCNLVTEKEYSVTLLTEHTPIKPTKDNIIKELNELILSDANELFFSYSGHGSFIRDLNRDEKDGRDECLVSLDCNLIVDDEINKIIQQLRPEQRLFCIIDACHSGSVLDLAYNYDCNTNSLVKDELCSDNINGDVLMISGCLDNQYSMDTIINDQGQGALTATFIHIYNELFGSGNCTYSNLITSIRNKLVEDGYDQLPNLASNKLLDLFEQIKI